MNLFLICTGLFLVIVSAAWPILLVMSYSSKNELEARLKALETENAPPVWWFLRHFQNHRIAVAWAGLVLVMLGMLVQ